jgi:hypothetical protein
LKKPSPAQLSVARRLLAHEGAAGGADDAVATAAARVYDKLDAHLAPLIGTVGVQSLFVRSAKLTPDEFAALAHVSILEGSTKLREHWQAQGSAVDVEAAAALFANFLSLLTTFIGERLVTQVLRNAWPKIQDMPQETPEETPPTEKK